MPSTGPETGEELGQVQVSPVPVSAVVLHPMVQKDEAEEKLRNRVIEELTQKVRIKQVKGDTIFYEERILKTREEGYRASTSSSSTCRSGSSRGRSSWS